MLERLIGIFALDCFAIDGADTMRAAFGEEGRVAIEFHAHHFIYAAGRIVPVDFVSGDVVDADARR